MSDTDSPVAVLPGPRLDAASPVPFPSLRSDVPEVHPSTQRQTSKRLMRPFEGGNLDLTRHSIVEAGSSAGSSRQGFGDDEDSVDMDIDDDRPLEESPSNTHQPGGSLSRLLHRHDSNSTSVYDQPRHFFGEPVDHYPLWNTPSTATSHVAPPPSRVASQSVPIVDPPTIHFATREPMFRSDHNSLRQLPNAPGHHRFPRFDALPSPANHISSEGSPATLVRHITTVEARLDRARQRERTPPTPPSYPTVHQGWRTRSATPYDIPLSHARSNPLAATGSQRERDLLIPSPRSVNSEATVPSPRPSSSPYRNAISNSSLSRRNMLEDVRYPIPVPPFMDMSEDEMLRPARNINDRRISTNGAQGPPSFSRRSSSGRQSVSAEGSFGPSPPFLDRSEDEMLREDMSRIRASARGNSAGPPPFAASSLESTSGSNSSAPSTAPGSHHIPHWGGHNAPEMYDVRLVNRNGRLANMYREEVQRLHYGAPRVVPGDGLDFGPLLPHRSWPTQPIDNRPNEAASPGGRNRTSGWDVRPAEGVQSTDPGPSQPRGDHDREALNRNIRESVGRRLGAYRRSSSISDSASGSGSGSEQTQPDRATSTSSSGLRLRRAPAPDLWGELGEGRAERSQSPRNTSARRLAPLDWQPNRVLPVELQPFAASLSNGSASADEEDEDDWLEASLFARPMALNLGDLPPPLNMTTIASLVDLPMAFIPHHVSLGELRLSHDMSEEEKNKTLSSAVSGLKRMSAGRRRNMTDSVLETVEWGKFEEKLRVEMEKDEYCSVCHDEYEETTEISITPCKHMYHKGCLSTWLQTSNTSSCPMCRRDLALLAAITKMVPEKTIEHALPYWYQI